MRTSQRREDTRRSLRSQGAYIPNARTNMRYDAKGYNRSAGADMKILSNIFREGGSIAGSFAKETGKDMVIKGRADAEKDTKDEKLAEENKKYRENFYMTQGEKDASVEYTDAIWKWRSENPNATPEEFKTWAQSKRQEFLGKNDNDAYAIGFSKALNIEARHKEDITKKKITRTHQKNLTNHKTVFLSEAGNYVNKDGEVDYESLRKLMSHTQSDLKRSLGMNKLEANEVMLNALKELAIEKEDKAILEVFSMIDDDGQKPWVADIRAAKKEVERAIDRKERDREEERLDRKRDIAGEYGRLMAQGNEQDAHKLMMENADLFGVSQAWLARKRSQEHDYDEDLEEDILFSAASGDLRDRGYSEDVIEEHMIYDRISINVAMKALKSFKETGTGVGSSLTSAGFMKTLEAELSHLPTEQTRGLEEHPLGQRALNEYQHRLVELQDLYDVGSKEFQTEARKARDEVIGKYNDIYRNWKENTYLQPFIKRINKGEFNVLTDDALSEFGAIWGDPNMTPAKAEEIIQNVHNWTAHMRHKEQEEQPEGKPEDQEGDTPFDESPLGKSLDFIGEKWGDFIDTIKNSEEDYESMVDFMEKNPQLREDMISGEVTDIPPQVGQKPGESILKSMYDKMYRMSRDSYFPPTLR